MKALKEKVTITNTVGELALKVIMSALFSSIISGIVIYTILHIMIFEKAGQVIMEEIITGVLDGTISLFRVVTVFVLPIFIIVVTVFFVYAIVIVSKNSKNNKK